MNLYRLGLCGVLVTAAGVLFAHPRTVASVFKPATSAVVSHAKTDTIVTKPKTTVQVYRPATSVTVSHPATSVMVSQPKTEVRVFHPVTSVEATHPGERAVPAPAAGGDLSSSSGKKSAPVNSVPSSSLATSMSGYKAPQAKDFKAAALGGGTSGLGNKTDEAAKDIAAASFQAPKGEEVSLEAVLKNANGVGQSKITKAVEAKVK